MYKKFISGLCGVLVLGLLCAPAMAMNKGELIDAIAKDAGLSKADAKRALDGFVSATSGALKKGDRISLVGFGSFSVTRQVSSPTGCPTTGEVTFIPASTFDADGNSPFRMRINEINDVDSDGDGVPDDGLVAVSGPNNGEDIALGDEVRLASRVEVRGWDPSKKSAPGVGGGIVIGIVVAILDPDSDNDGLSDGLVLRGIEKADIRRGMGIEGLPLPLEKPQEKCDDGALIIIDDHLLALMEKLSGTSPEILFPAYNAMLDIIIRVVNSGEEVDIEEFGNFHEEDEVVLTTAARTGRNPQTGKEIKIAAKGLSDTELIALTRAAARTGRNPQTGATIQIKAKKVAKFKAGKALADTVK